MRLAFTCILGFFLLSTSIDAQIRVSGVTIGLEAYQSQNINKALVGLYPIDVSHFNQTNVLQSRLSYTIGSTLSSTKHPKLLHQISLLQGSENVSWNGYTGYSFPFHGEYLHYQGRFNSKANTTGLRMGTQFRSNIHKRVQPYIGLFSEAMVAMPKELIIIQTDLVYDQSRGYNRTIQRYIKKDLPAYFNGIVGLDLGASFLVNKKAKMLDKPQGFVNYGFIANYNWSEIKGKFDSFFLPGFKLGFTYVFR